MSTTLKEWLVKTITELEEERDAVPGAVNEDAAKALAAMKLALASLDAEPVGFIARHKETGKFGSYLHPKADWFKNDDYEVLSAYTAPPAPVSVPDAMTPKQASRAYCGEVRGYRDGWNACRAAMLQGADGTLTNEGTIPVTQFKPVADLYGLTSPTGGETSFTFDAVEARDFIDGGWSCQEYVELERFQEAITNHTEDKLAMVDHSGDSNNMVEPVMTAYKLPFEQWLSQQTGTIDVECGCVMTEVFFHWLRVAYEAGNSPVIPDGWVLVPVEPTMSQEFAGYRTLTDTGKMSRLMKTRLSNIYRAMIAAAPQQEVKP